MNTEKTDKQRENADRLAFLDSLPDRGATSFFDVDMKRIADSIGETWPPASKIKPLRIERRSIQKPSRGGGPRSIAGKKTSASNSLKHGVTAKQTVLPSENADDFAAFEQQMLTDPHGTMRDELCKRVASTLWRWRRIDKALDAMRKNKTQSDEKTAAIIKYEAHLRRTALALWRELAQIEKIPNELPL